MRNNNIEVYRRVGRFMHVRGLEYIAAAFPKLTIVGAHMGGPWYDEAIGLAYGYPNIYFDISCPFLVRNVDVVRRALTVPGLENKLLFATDAYERHPQGFERFQQYFYFWDFYFEWSVTPEVRKKVMGENAQRLLLASRAYKRRIKK